MLNICKYLRCHDPKGDMIQMIYPENRKNYLNGWVAQHEALVRICVAHRTNAPKKFRLNSHKSFLNHSTSALWLLVWFGLNRFVLLLSFSSEWAVCVRWDRACVYFFHHQQHFNISIIVTSFPLFGNMGGSKVTNQASSTLTSVT